MAEAEVVWEYTGWMEPGKWRTRQRRWRVRTVQGTRRTSSEMNHSESSL